MQFSTMQTFRKMGPYPHLCINAYYALFIHNMHFCKGEDTVPFFETVRIVVNCVFYVFRVFDCSKPMMTSFMNDSMGVSEKLQNFFSTTKVSPRNCSTPVKSILLFPFKWYSLIQNVQFIIIRMANRCRPKSNGV